MSTRGGISIKSVEYLYEERKYKRQLRIRLSNGAKITAEACYESWQQWGGTRDELCITQPTVEQHNGWLHGGERP